MLVVFVLVAATALTGFYAVHVLSRARYLTYYPSHLDHGGNETKILLLTSSARYGSYNQSFHNQAGDVNKGDPCLIIKATIRNDYVEIKPSGYFISLTAWLYDIEGEVVGRVMTPPPLLGSLHGYFIEVNLENGETATLDIYVAYEKQDVDHYELYIVNIQDAPTP